MNTHSKHRHSNRSAEAAELAPKSKNRSHAWGKYLIFGVLIVVGLLGVKFLKPSNKPVAAGYEIVNVHPHDAKSFTQGLLFHNGKLFESTGLDRSDETSLSQVKIVDVTSGKSEKEVTLEGELFGEGLALLGNELYQLTWQDHKVFVYDLELNLIKELPYEAEGWGLTTDGKLLILSDGTNVLRFLNPKDLSVVREIDVRHRGNAVSRLNELEFLDGYVYANVWYSDLVYKIDASTGKVVQVYDFTDLMRHDRESVLNGIAYDAATKRWFVTGKLWPKMFEVKLLDQ
jgi:glutamine cyclotransferase